MDQNWHRAFALHGEKLSVGHTTGQELQSPFDSVTGRGDIVRLMSSDPIDWLLGGDVSIQYQVRRDLQGADAASDGMRALRDRIAREGWGARFLAARGGHGHWGRAFYQPKWTSSNYTLLDLRTLEAPATPQISETIHAIVLQEKGSDGGIDPSRTIGRSDVCINGMFLNYACFYGEPEDGLRSVVDFVLSQVMPDGGFNCHMNRSGAYHSSMHSTISVLEGITEYEIGGYTYRIDELRSAAASSREFLLRHRLFKSDRTGEIIHKDFLRLAFPPRWKFNVLRALDHFRRAAVSWDERMTDALQVVVDKRRPDGLWPVQSAWPGQVHFRMEEPREPSRWNTLIAMRVLQAAEVTRTSASAFARAGRGRTEDRTTPRSGMSRRAQSTSGGL